MKLLKCSLSVILIGLTDAWTTPLTNKSSPLQRRHGTTVAVAAATTTARNAFPTQQSPQSLRVADECDVIVTKKTASMTADNEASSATIPASDATPNMGVVSASLVGLAALAASPEAASAAITTTATAASSTVLTAAGGASSAVPSALFAYGHYFSVLAVVGILMTERLTLENGPNLTEDEENRLAIADTLYGVVALLLVYTGYCRFSDPALGKGTYFYVHEPIFWLKMTMLGVMGSASLFNTTKIIQRSIARFSGEKVVEPMSEALCNRMKSICNAQLTAIVFIPMAATFMARGVGYTESIPWQVEAAGAAAIFLGLGFKYVKEALTFEARLLETENETSNTMVS